MSNCNPYIHILHDMYNHVQSPGTVDMIAKLPADERQAISRTYHALVSTKHRRKRADGTVRPLPTCPSRTETHDTFPNAAVCAGQTLTVRTKAFPQGARWVSREKSPGVYRWYRADGEARSRESRQPRDALRTFKFVRSPNACLGERQRNTTRKPPFRAHDCPGKVALGMNGKMYVSLRNISNDGGAAWNWNAVDSKHTQAHLRAHPELLRDIDRDALLPDNGIQAGPQAPCPPPNRVLTKWPRASNCPGERRTVNGVEKMSINTGNGYRWYATDTRRFLAGNYD